MDEKKTGEPSLPNTELNETVGDYLKKTREAKKISLEEVSQRTRILLTVLKDLENNNFDELPNQTYVRGFTKSFAKEIGADVQLALKILDRQYIDRQKGKKPHIPKTDLVHKFEDEGHFMASSKKSKIKVSLKLPLMSILVVGILGVIGYHIIKGILTVPMVTNSERSETEQVTEEIPTSPAIPEVATGPAPTPIVPPVLKPQEITATPVPVVENTTKEATTETPNTTPDLKKEKENESEKVKESEKKDEDKDKKEVKEEEKEAEEPKTVIQLKKISKPGYSVRSDAPENSDTQLLPQNIRDSSSSGGQNLYVQATSGDSWITYKIDDKPIQTTVVRKGSSIFLQGQEVRIVLGNVGATKIFLNNQILKVDSTSGSKNLVFPEKSVQKYKAPLFVWPEKGGVMTSDEYEKSDEFKKPEPLATPVKAKSSI